MENKCQTLAGRNLHGYQSIRARKERRSIGLGLGDAGDLFRKMEWIDITNTIKFDILTEFHQTCFFKSKMH